MVILVLNCGSSSIKYQVIDMEDASSKLLAKGIVERIGLPEGDLTHNPSARSRSSFTSRFPTTRPASSSCSTPSPTPPTA